ncbi:MAG: LamG domain-containing protein [Candidatus Nomurabacteria bacterium]|nr:LamG domain-containing protein [Candidatus Nomurabacteria bacterium]
MSSIYDGTGVRGVIDNTTSFLATTGALAYNTTTVWALGTNPRGTSAYSDFYNGRFSAVRIYSRALSANELCQNDWVDYYRFGGTLPDCLLGSLPTPTITATVAGELCTNLTIQNANQLTCLTPESPLPGSDTVSPYREGTVDVVVTVDGVDTTSSDRDNYTYVAPMAIASVTPNSGLITGGTEITISGPFAVPSGYVPSGLVVHYDGIDNTSSGHSSTTTTWKNLVSSSYDGTLTGTFSSDFGWGANHLQFKGSNVSRFVDTGSAHNIDKPTVEVVMSGSASGGTQMLAGNVESSGYGLALSSTGQPHFMSYIGSNYAYVYSNAITSGQVTSISGSFDGSTLRLITTGAKTQTVTAGSIKASSYAFTLGVNRGVSNIEPFVDGQIYAFRLYNRALTDAEVIANQMLDYMRFGGVPPVTVTLDYGGTPAACNNVKLIDENTIKCTTTAHAAGPVNVQVANSAMSATLPAAFTYYEEPFISLSVDSNLDISATPGILAADHVTANVKTNNPSGYDLSISASSVDLVCESDSSKKILALPSAAGPMSNNRWGYAVDGGSLTVPSSWKGVTNSLVPIAGSSTPTDPDTGVDTTVWVGTRVDYSLPVCSYIGNVTFTAVAWI